MEVFTYLNGRTSSGIEIESKRYLDSFKFRISYIMLGASDVSVLNSKMNNAWIKASGDYFIIIRGSRKSMALPSVSKLSVYRQNKLKLHGRWLFWHKIILFWQSNVVLVKYAFCIPRIKWQGFYHI